MSADSPSSTRELRQFGFTVGACFGLIFGILLPILHHLRIAGWPWCVLAVFWLLAIAWPRGLKEFHFLWLRLGQMLGWINTRIVLGLVFYLILMPAGLVMRLLGRDPMTRNFDPQCQSYRIRSQPSPAERMAKPY